MTKKILNQNDIINTEIINSYDFDYIFSNNPINRVKKEPLIVNKTEELKKLEEKIQNIEDCKLKKNATKIVFAEGNIDSPIMIVGEGPGQKEDELGKPFVGDSGMLLNKMLTAININRKNVYVTNVVNFRPPNDRKPDSNEIKKYSNFLKNHISIIDPKILVIMGSTAMEALFGTKIKISKERGDWKELIINNKTYLAMITFHPAYLLRQADQKKYSWVDLKKIKKKVDELKINFR
ncbi:MAG: uracil-DNA glycosylase [Pelagibacteraceae bacterium TMED268]|nr:MAG: uracil-DNA glycosylase [Pelagibacteraceae bacterium TMED268]|tara:strand:+ start:2549 stop:3256 length:708 start_codon:yes stop_codon:yes gene_type:complete